MLINEKHWKPKEPETMALRLTQARFFLFRYPKVKDALTSAAKGELLDTELTMFYQELLKKKEAIKKTKSYVV